MYFESLNGALTMAGHGTFVWSAYGICLFVLALILIAPGRRQRKFLRQLGGEQKRLQRSQTTIGEGH